MKLHQEGECFDMGDGSEDENWECESKKNNGFALEGQVNREDETNQESLPVLTMGPFAGYAHRAVVAGLDLLTFPKAGSLCFFICTQTRYSSHLLNPKVTRYEKNTFKRG